MSNKLAFIPEIGASMLSKNVTGEQSVAFKANPADFLKSNYDISTSAEVKTVENSNDTINLTLPYYSNLDTASAGPMTDGDMDSVAGGEIFISLVVLGTGAAVVAGITTGAMASEAAKKGENLDGSAK